MRGPTIEVAVVQFALEYINSLTLDLTDLAGNNHISLLFHACNFAENLHMSNLSHALSLGICVTKMWLSEPS